MIRVALDQAIEGWGSDSLMPDALPLVSMAQVVADLIDAGESDAGLVREFRMLLKDLREVLRGDDDGGIGDLINELRSAPMGDSSDS